MILKAFLDAHPDAVEVRLIRVRGSAPREAGAGMIVSPTACHGTIGGGQLEYMVIDAARAMLARHVACRDLDIPLGPEIGQCCGGHVTVTLRRMDAATRRAALARAGADAAAQPHVCIMGAGHVGRALARLMVQMPVRTLVVDSRPAELALCPPGGRAPRERPARGRDRPRPAGQRLRHPHPRPCARFPADRASTGAQ
ncbi:MAG: XdhC family protein [Roseovarius sp.]|nr:XdhC family protein [Roseovarius sp.]